MTFVNSDSNGVVSWTKDTGTVSDVESAIGAGIEAGTSSGDNKSTVLTFGERLSNVFKLSETFSLW